MVGNQSLGPHETSMTELSINVIGTSAYAKEEQMMARMAQRPSTTVQGQREQLRTSQVMIGPHEFD